MDICVWLPDYEYVHFHEFVQEIKDGLIEIFFGPLVLPLMQSNHPQEKSRSPLMPNK